MSPITTRRDGHVLEVTLDRPKANAIDLATSRVMGETFRAFRDDESLRVAIVTAAGEKFFCPGWDLKAAAGGDAVDGDYGVGGFGGLQELPQMNKPVIAAINGAAAGVGATMPLACDIRLASTKAKFLFPFVRRGIVPESCSSWFLPRIVGLPTALEWTLTGRLIGAEEALSRDLVRSVHEPDALLPAARAIAKEIADNTAPQAVALTRQMIWRMLGAKHPMEAHRADSRGVDSLGKTPDVYEGVASFLEKRDAVFKGSLRDLPDIFPDWEEPEFR
jgi:enoyl-CoA hydratase/carnithine racemase